MSITQLAVFEAVNAITKQYEPYPGTPIVASVGASVDAAAVTAAYRVLKTYFPANAATRDRLPGGDRGAFRRLGEGQWRSGRRGGGGENDRPSRR